MKKISLPDMVILVLMVMLFLISLILVGFNEPGKVAIAAEAMLITIFGLSIFTAYMERNYTHHWLHLLFILIIIFSVSVAIAGILMQRLWAIITMTAPWVGLRLAAILPERKTGKV
ncbi:MAG: hypothetical protein ACM3PY_05890 [Omnitrophica WOR_2 bacterium]